jgi:uncharacterized membrane protein HdeD (DUF308 family)
MSEEAQVVKKAGGRMTLFGILTMVLGLLALSSPLVVGGSVVMLIGILVLVAGIARFAWAFKAEGGERVFLLVVGALTTLVGALMIANPVFTAGVLTVLLAFYFIADGLFEIMGSLKVKPEPGWGWMLFAGIVSLALGILIWRQFPLSGPVAIGVFIGIKLFLAGLMMITVGQTVRSAVKAAGS